MSGVATFAQELLDLGYQVEQRGAFVIFDYSVEIGTYAGHTVEIALDASAHPHSPPTGPMVSPRLLPIRPDGSPAPLGGVHDAHGRSGFHDPDGRWQYWSRPFAEWLPSGRSAKAYIEIHLRRLFAALPTPEQPACTT